MDKIVLALEGAAAATVIPSLTGTFGAEVVAVTIDLGAGRALEEERNQALRGGAARAHVLDVRDEFAREYLVPALRADALSGDAASLMRALGDAIFARKVVDIAAIERADAVAHTLAAGTPFHTALESIAPDLRIVALGNVERQAQHGHELRPMASGRAARRGAAVSAEIAFQRGVAMEINGVAMPIVDLMASLGTLAGALDGHGAGRAAVILHTAHRALCRSVMPRDLDRLCRSLNAKYRALIAHGLWFAPMRRALDGFFDAVHERVSGTVCVDFDDARCRVSCVRSSPAELTQHDASLVGSL